MTETPTVGDPEAIRAVARELLKRADLVRGLAAPAVARLGAAVFEGPAAARLRAEAAQAASQLSGAANDLSALAAALLSDATSVEAENATLRRTAEAALAVPPPVPAPPAPPEVEPAS